jgi:hypothetical protein
MRRKSTEELLVKLTATITCNCDCKSSMGCDIDFRDKENTFMLHRAGSWRCAYTWYRYDT